MYFNSVFKSLEVDVTLEKPRWLWYEMWGWPSLQLFIQIKREEKPIQPLSAVRYLSDSESMVLGPLPREGQQWLPNRSKQSKWEILDSALVWASWIISNFQEWPLSGIAHGCYLQVNNPDDACIYSYDFN